MNDEDPTLLKAIRARANGEYKIPTAETAARVFKRDSKELLDRLDHARSLQDYWFSEAKKMERDWRDAKTENLSLRAELQMVKRRTVEVKRLTNDFHNAIHSTLT